MGGDAQGLLQQVSSCRLGSTLKALSSKYSYEETMMRANQAKVERLRNTMPGRRKVENVSAVDFRNLELFPADSIPQDVLYRLPAYIDDNGILVPGENLAQ